MYVCINRWMGWKESSSSSSPPPPGNQQLKAKEKLKHEIKHTRIHGKIHFLIIIFFIYTNVALLCIYTSAPLYFCEEEEPSHTRMAYSIYILILYIIQCIFFLLQNLLELNAFLVTLFSRTSRLWSCPLQQPSISPQIKLLPAVIVVDHHEALESVSCSFLLLLCSVAKDESDQ